MACSLSACNSCMSFATRCSRSSSCTVKNALHQANHKLASTHPPPPHTHTHTQARTPLPVESFGRLGKPMMRLISDIGNLAVSRGDGLFSKEQCVSGALRKLSASLCKTNARLEHGVSGFFVWASGVCIRHGRSRPTAEVSDWD
jgi:hypothetical protein